MAIEQETAVRLLLRERAKVLAYVGLIVRDEHSAEDIFQEVSILALQKLDEIESEAHFLGWIRRAARFKAFKALRDLGKTPSSLDDAMLDLLEPHWERLDRVDSLDLLDLLKKCLQKLSPEARRLVYLRYTENMDGATIASTLQRSVNGVYVAMSRIHRRLAICMQQQLPSGERPHV